MTAVKAGDVARALRSRPEGVYALLFYGPDAGRVSENARAVAQESASDPADPMQLVRLDGDSVAEGPGHLMDEAATYGLFGSRRTVWVKPTSRNIAPALAACLEPALSDVLIVVEAGDLSRTSPLRALCERSARAFALPCYQQTDRERAETISAAVQAAGLKIEPEARELLVHSLGTDTLATKAELEKLVTYAAGQTLVTVDDVVSVVSDVSATNVDVALDAAFAGDFASLDAALGRLSATGIAPAAILAATLRHLLSLARACDAIGRGEPPDSALREWRGMPFQRRPAVTAQARAWRGEALLRLIGDVQDATLQTRLFPASAGPVVARLLTRVAEMSRRQAAATPRNLRHNPSS